MLLGNLKWTCCLAVYKGHVALQHERDMLLDHTSSVQAIISAVYLEPVVCLYVMALAQGHVILSDNLDTDNQSLDSATCNWKNTFKVAGHF